MNVIKTILLFVCFATHINSVEAAWKNIERPFNGVILVDPELTIEYQTTGQCHFFKISLYGGRIIILDVCKNDITPMQHINTPQTFSGKVMLAFEKINSNPIGKELLKQLKTKIDRSDPLVIIHHDILLNVLEYNNVIDRNTAMTIMRYDIGDKECAELISKLTPKLSDSRMLPDVVLGNLTTHEDKSEWFQVYYLPKMLVGSAFFCKEDTGNGDPGLPYNTVMLNFELKEPKLFGFSQKFDLSGPEDRLIQANTNITIARCLEHEDDITLFHELNHARHRIYGISTYDKDGNTQAKRHSSLGIQITDADERTSTMVNAEEELQLTGFTQLNRGEIISDNINEISYRFHSRRHIRFPYEVNPKRPDSTCYISLEHLKLLLSVSLRPIYNVFSVD